MGNIKKVWFILSYNQRFFAGFLTLGMLINAILESISIGLVLPLIGLINNVEKVKNNALINRFSEYFGLSDNKEILIYIFYVFIAVYIFKTIFAICLGYARQRFVAGLMYEISRRLFKFYLQGSWTFHLKKNSSELQNNVVIQVGTISTGLVYSLFNLSTELFVTVGIIILLVITDPETTLFVFSILTIISLVFFYLIRGKLESYGTIAQEFTEKMIKTTDEAFGGIKETKILGREDYYVSKFGKNVFNYTKSWIYPSLIHIIQKSMIEIIFIGGIVIISLHILMSGGDSSYLLAILSLFAAAAFRLMPSVTRISVNIAQVKYYTPILSTIYNDIQSSLNNSQRKLSSKKRASSDFMFQDGIRLENVCFKYPGTKDNILNSISILIPKGYSAGFIGPSGSGKTTLIDIILGLLKPNSGRVMFDDLDVHKNLSLWQKHIGYIPQNIFLSDNTIRKNVAFGLPNSEIDDNKIWEAINHAQLKEVIRNLPDGLDTRIGENGLKISGGQRQRIGIARALYHDPEVLVLDEATSSLDNKTENEISNAINKLSKEKTLLIIAHRLSTLENCDLRFHLKNGKIEKTGKR